MQLLIIKGIFLGKYGNDVIMSKKYSLKELRDFEAGTKFLHFHVEFQS